MTFIIFVLVRAAAHALIGCARVRRFLTRSALINDVLLCIVHLCCHHRLRGPALTMPMVFRPKRRQVFLILWSFGASFAFGGEPTRAADERIVIGDLSTSRYKVIGEGSRALSTFRFGVCGDRGALEVRPGRRWQVVRDIIVDQGCDLFHYLLTSRLLSF